MKPKMLCFCFTRIEFNMAPAVVSLRCSYYAFAVSDGFAVGLLDFPVIIT